MSTYDPKKSDQTITLDSSNETDIIDCSIEEIYNKNEFFKTPRSHLNRKCTSAKKNEVISLRGFQFSNENLQVKSPAVEKADNSLRFKLWSSFKANDSVILDDSIITSTPESSKRNENKNDAILNNLLPGLKDSPYLPYLCKSKLNRIGNWLNENDIETVTTPPFSKNKKSSLRLRKTSSARSLAMSQTENDDSSDSSIMDPEIEQILVAVYGKNWRAKNIIKKSKTEPKRRKKPIFSINTDVKNKVGTEVKLVKTVRRNILKTGVRRGVMGKKNSDQLDSPCSLGVGKLNESGSTDNDSIGKRLSSRRKRKMMTPPSTSPSKKPAVSRKKTGGVKTTPTGSNRKKPTGSNRKTPTGSNRKTEAGSSTNKKSKESNSDDDAPMKTFLASLSVSTPKRKCDPEAQDFKINFRKKKQELALRLFRLYNSEVFGNQLPDDMKFTWNMKMRRAAGYCCNKKIITPTGQIIRTARIELSAKIVDRADRLRDTLIHELCHAASWIIDGMLDGHGIVWAKWSRKAMKKFPELPPIKRCHSFMIASKYTYKCTGCGYSINRCSKSINTERKRCGFCFGVLELFVNRLKKGKREVPEFQMIPTGSTPNKFALFIKENYHNVKHANMAAKHGEIMKILSQKYAEMKNAAKGKNQSKKETPKNKSKNDTSEIKLKKDTSDIKLKKDASKNKSKKDTSEIKSKKKTEFHTTKVWNV